MFQLNISFHLYLFIHKTSFQKTTKAFFCNLVSEIPFKNVPDSLQKDLKFFVLIEF